MPKRRSPRSGNTCGLSLFGWLRAEEPAPEAPPPEVAVVTEALASAQATDSWSSAFNCSAYIYYLMHFRAFGLLLSAFVD